MILAAWDVKEWAAALAPGVALFIGVITLLLSGERAERQRRRELYARGLAATIAYGEMPFAIRRRQHEPDRRSAERVRLTVQFSEIQAELAICQTLIDAEHDAEVAATYCDLVEATRRIAGSASRTAWNDDPIERDPDVNMPDLAEELQPLVRDDHPLAVQSEVTLAAVADHPILMHARSANPEQYDFITALFTRAGLTPRLVARPIAFDPTNRMIRDGRAIGLVGISSMDGLAAGLRWVPLAEPDAQIAIQLVLRDRDLSPAADRFERLAVATAAGNGWLGSRAAGS
jgi:LysR substrate binding domain